MKNSNKTVFYGLAILAGSVVTAVLSTPAPVSAQAPGATVCLNVTEIQTTQATDMRTIIYRMRNGDVWRNDLAYPCPDLVNFSAGGYSQTLHTDWLCANKHTITTQTGSVCRLGRFTLVN
jgi:hypothetical protein